MDRKQLFGRLERTWLDFRESYAGLSDSELTKSGVSGDWSVRDILAHVTTWEREALKHLPTILKGGKPPRYSVAYGEINAFNRITTEQKRSLTLFEVRRELEETHQRLVDFIETIAKEQFRTKTPFRHRPRLDTYSHYPKHASAIKKWRKQQLDGEKKI